MFTNMTILKYWKYPCHYIWNINDAKVIVWICIC